MPPNFTFPGELVWLALPDDAVGDIVPAVIVAASLFPVDIEGTGAVLDGAYEVVFDQGGDNGLRTGNDGAVADKTVDEAEVGQIGDDDPDAGIDGAVPDTDGAVPNQTADEVEFCQRTELGAAFDSDGAVPDGTTSELVFGQRTADGAVPVEAPNEDPVPAKTADVASGNVV